MSEKKKKVFISGPMSGIKDFNKPAFDKAEKELTECGFSVFNPARMHFDDTWTHEQIMKIDLAALAQCDYIYMLPKWYYSKGAIQEYHYAGAVGVKMLDGNDILKSKCEMESAHIKDCQGCAYRDTSVGSEPCVTCIHNYIDYGARTGWKSVYEKDKLKVSTKPRIQIESFGDISGRNLDFLQWFEKYCNKVLAKGETLPGSVDTAIDDLNDYICNELGIKTCGTCVFKDDSRLAPCLNCGPFKNWKPKQTPDAPKKSCSTCKYGKYTMHEEPCASCDINHTNWEPKDAEK